MSSWPKLPLELLLKVLKKIDRRDIIECQLACRSWIRATQVALYRDTVLTSPEQAAGFLHAIVSSPSYPGKHVQRLTLSSELFIDASVWDPLDLVSSLVEHCPNIEILKLGRSFKPFWVRLLHERVSGNWSLLKDIPTPQDNNEIEYYVYSALAFKDTLESLLLCDSLAANVTDSLHDMEFRTLAKQLKNFKALGSLDIRHHTEKKLIEMDSLIEDCQSLKELSIALYPSLVQPVNTEPETLTDEELAKIKPHPRITKLTVSTAIKSENAFKYIMRKFPSLCNLSFNETTTKNAQTIMKKNRFRMSKEVIDQLVEYIHKVSMSYNISFLFIDNISDLIGSLAHSSLVHLHQLAISYEIDDINEVELDNSPRMKLEKKANNTKPTVIVFYRANSLSTQLPHMQLLVEIGAELETLFIDLSRKVEHMEQGFQLGGIAESTLKGYYVDQALLTCKNLKVFKIFGSILMSCNPSRIINDSVEELEVFNCKLQAQVLTELAVRMPNMKSLVLRNCDYLTSGGQIIASRNYFLIDMPYASLKKLKWFGIAETTATASHFFVKVSTSTGEMYYKAGERLEHCIAGDYNSAMKNKEYLKFHIRCKAVESFTVKYAGFDRVYMISTSRPLQ